MVAHADLDLEDHVLRAVTDDGAFRVIALVTKHTVAGIVNAQRADAVRAHVLADLVTATIMVRELMSPDFRVQGIVTYGKKNHLVSDAHPNGATRGLVTTDSAEPLMLSGQRAKLQMMRSLHNGALHQGFVEVPERGGFSAAIMEYLQISEQIVAIAAVGNVVLPSGTVRAAGGYVIQLLPEASRSKLQVMTDRMRSFVPIEERLARSSCEPRRVVRDILEGMPYTETARSQLRYGCTCSEDRVMTSLATIARDELQEMVDAGEILDIACEYCGVKYPLAPEKLRGMLSPN